MPAGGGGREAGRTSSGTAAESALPASLCSTPHPHFPLTHTHTHNMIWGPLPAGVGLPSGTGIFPSEGADPVVSSLGDFRQRGLGPQRGRGDDTAVPPALRGRAWFTPAWGLQVRAGEHRQHPGVCSGSACPSSPAAPPLCDSVPQQLPLSPSCVPTPSSSVPSPSRISPGGLRPPFSSLPLPVLGGPGARVEPGVVPCSCRGPAVGGSRILGERTALGAGPSECVGACEQWFYKLIYDCQVVKEGLCVRFCGDSLARLS